MSPFRSQQSVAVALPGLEGQVETERRSIVASHYGRRDYLLRRLLLSADLFALLLALVVAAAIDPRPGANVSVVTLGIAMAPVWAVLFKMYGLYDRDGKRVSHGTVDDLPWVFHGVVIGTLLVWLWLKGVEAQLPFASVLSFGITAVVAVLASRSLVRKLALRILGPERVLLVGEEGMTQVLLRKMRDHPEYGLAPVGVAVDRAAGASAGALDVPVLGETSDVLRLTEEHRIDRLVLSHSDLLDTDALDIMRRCKEMAIKVSVIPEVFDALGPSVEVDDVEGVTLLGINPPVLGRSSRAMKRCLDLAGSIALLVLTAPVLIAIALAVKLESRGPVFFRQSRVGRAGTHFKVVKFRTMHRDAEARVDELLAHSRDPNWLHLEDDPRITRVGHFLRLASLDELPQLWNVLKGEMSLVGPRPLIESEDRQVAGWARSRLDLTPGITGVWQVLGRTNIPFDEMVKLDYLYVTNWSLWTDVRLLLRTLPVVFMRRGAN
jgi:exopolysaccharide biosynthesis polyprenyl glycosylphosphotransferase